MNTAEFLSGYLSEVDEHLRLSTTRLLSIEADLKAGRASPKAVRELFRSLHTVKGLSAMVGVEPVVAVAHAMETVLRVADQAGGKLPPWAVELLLRGVQAIEERVRAVAAKATVPPAPAALLEALERLELAEGAAPLRPGGELLLPDEILARLSPSDREQLVSGHRPPRRALRVDFVPSQDRSAAGVGISTVRDRLGRIAEIVKVVPLSRSTPDAPAGLAFALLLVSEAADREIAAAADAPVEEVQTIVREAAAPEPLGPGTELADVGTDRGAHGVVRVEVARLDDALEKLSALVVTRFRLSRAVARLSAGGADVRELTQIVQENERQLRDLRGSIMRARMIPAHEMLERVPLLVRGLALATGKQVRLEMDAGSAELDKAVADRVFPAVVHLVRNAVDHALEQPDEREALGKAREGLIRITCFGRANNQLELTVEDDGRGIDRAAVAARAGRAEPQTDEELLALITLPGLSTRDRPDATSGRGLGMDIVRRIVLDELGGELMLRTVPGGGSTFTVRIPLTITIVEAISFLCGAQPFVVPVSAVEEIIDVEPQRVTAGLPGRRRAQVRMLERRGVAVPLVALDRLFGLPGPEAPARKAIVVQYNGQPFAFEVDRMLGQQEVVVRPLEDPLVRVHGVVGATDLGDGQPTLVLDLVSLSGTLTSRAEGRA